MVLVTPKKPDHRSHILDLPSIDNTRACTLTMVDSKMDPSVETCCEDEYLVGSLTASSQTLSWAEEQLQGLLGAPSAGISCDALSMSSLICSASFVCPRCASCTATCIATDCRLFQNAVPAVLVAGHGPFCWGPTAAAAAHNAVILESIARMAHYTVTLGKDAQPIANELRDKHFLRKHGRGAYYGQVKAK
jgi:hypothetical protein